MKAAEQETILQQAVDLYGYATQEQMAVGECGEFLSLFGRRVQGRSNDSEFIDEIADVTIMMRQMARIYGVKEVQARIDYKLSRLKERMRIHLERNQE